MTSEKRVILFKVISILLPFLVLFLLEISLRVFHYGNNFSLFIEYKGNKDFLVLNPAASKRYFTNQALAPSGNAEPFKKKKDKNTLRIFVLGESTTIGYPYFHNGSFSRWLHYRLMHTFPDRQFEIINISLTAVNSYTVLGFSKDVVNYEPDAVMIYSGQNEYYGALGVGSTNRIGGNPHIIQLMLTLRQLRLTQLVTNLYEKITGDADLNNKKYKGETLMHRMVSDQQIAYQSKLYYKGIDQFTSNINETLNLFNSLHIPVFISNLVSNEKDLKPFISAPVDSIQFPGFKKNYEAGIKALENKDVQAADNYLERADQIFSSHALCNFYLGRLSYQQNDYKNAAVYFSRARDMDGLRFRAPGKLNEIISRLCNKYKFAHLVDTKSVFESFSDNHIIGNELMLEHVHPNLKGYAIISDAFYESMKKAHIISVDKKSEMSFQQLLQDMPVTKMDSLAGIYKISKLKKSWPFNEINSRDSIKIESEEEKLAYGLVYGRIQWPDAIDNLYNYYLANNELLKVKTVMETLVLEHPAEASYCEGTAAVCGKLNDFENAAFYFKRAFALSPSFDDSKTLFVIYLKLDEPIEAMPYIDYAIENNTSNLNLLPVKKFTEEIIQLQKDYVKDSTDIPLLNLIAGRYLNMGNKEGASKYIAKILKGDPKNKGALLLLEHIKKG